ncbi:hypothetical protein BW731_08960 [Vagococcus martis]|uniref:Uncharacterized protein n=1 Tax=Vagococcus martis TaxID=1768210 RepID=A0A1V4DII7_9ENTE|nr:hypothetical protein [Vagococcus martis]OPF88293.1 hypothetical protein BW731_08960 [Vagococcus martis]
MEKEQGKISMRLFKKEKVKPRTKSIIVMSDNPIPNKLTNQLEVLFDPVFTYQINQRLSVFFHRWQTVLAIYPIKKAFYHINDIGFIKLYISFGVTSLLDDVEIKHFFQTVQELLTAPYLGTNQVETSVPTFSSTLEKKATPQKNTLLAQDSVIDSLHDKLLEQDKRVKQWSDKQDREQQALMAQLDAIENENRLLQENLDRIQTNDYSGFQTQNALKDKVENNEHQSIEYREKFKVLSQELGQANKLISELEHNNTVLSSSLEQMTETKNALSVKEQEQSKELATIKERLTHAESEVQQLKESLEQEQSEKIRVFEQLQSDTREFESTIAYQEQQLVTASTTEFKMQSTIDELTMEKGEQQALMQALRLEKDSVKNELDKVVVEKENIIHRLEEQKQSYWELEKKLKEWIEKSQETESLLEEERERSEFNQSSLISDAANLRELNEKLNEENLYYQGEMRRLLKEVNRLSDRVAYLQQFVDQTLVEEKGEMIEEVSKINNDVEEEKRKKRYDDQGILKLFQKADDADSEDIKVPIEEYREYRLSLKFLEYRWYQANIMQVNATGESELTWSEVYVSESGEFFEDLENLVKIPLLSKKYVIMDKEVLLRLKAYQALSDYLERRYFKSSKHIFDRETNE